MEPWWSTSPADMNTSVISWKCFNTKGVLPQKLAQESTGIWIHSWGKEFLGPIWIINYVCVYIYTHILYIYLFIYSSINIFIYWIPLFVCLFNIFKFSLFIYLYCMYPPYQRGIFFGNFCPSFIFAYFGTRIAEISNLRRRCPILPQWSCHWSTFWYRENQEREGHVFCLDLGKGMCMCVWDKVHLL